MFAAFLFINKLKNQAMVVPIEIFGTNKIGNFVPR